MATHSSILAWRIPWTEEDGGVQSWGLKELDTTEQLNNNNSYRGIKRIKPGNICKALYSFAINADCYYCNC